MFGVPDEIPYVTRSLGMVERYRFIYGKSYFGFRKKVQFFGIVPGSFQKVPKDSGGVRKSTSGSTTSQGLAWAKGRRPGLIGPGAPSPQKPTQLGKEKGES